MASSSALLDKLSSLQNHVKRDPSSYAEEFRLQAAAFASELALLRLHVGRDSEPFRQLASFMAHVAPYFPAECAELPAQLLALLSEHAAALFPEVRRGAVKALVLLRARGVVADPLPLLKVLFALFRVRDRALRDILFAHIVADCRALAGGGGGGGGGGAAATRAVQGFMYAMLGDGSAIAARKSLEVMVELYKRQVWTDARCVNVMATALASPRVKLVVVALKFFLGMGGGGGGDGEGEDLDDIDSSEDEGGDRRAAAGAVGGVSKANQQEIERNLQHVKKTRKRKREAAKAFSEIKRAQRKASRRGEGAKPVFPAIQVLHDPQGVAEGLLAAVRSGPLARERFEVRLLALNLTSRLVGQHRLLLLPLYSFLGRYLEAHQAHVTQVLSFLIQAAHDGVPPDEVAGVVRAVMKGFVHEGARPEVVQLGVNTVREVVARCPPVLAEPGMDVLVGELVALKGYKGSKGVVAAARAVLNLVRDVYPALLKRRDLGKEVAMAGGGRGVAPSVYGARVLSRGVEGEELLALSLAHRELRAGAGGGGGGGGGGAAATTGKRDWERVQRDRLPRNERKRLRKGEGEEEEGAQSDEGGGEGGEGVDGEDDEEEEEGDDDDEGEGEDEEDGEEEEEEEENDDDDEEDDDEEDDDDEEEGGGSDGEEEGGGGREGGLPKPAGGRSMGSAPSGSAAQASSSLASAAATRRALAARLSAAISAGAVAGAAPAAAATAISETRILTPKDFARIRKLQAALAEKGITRPTAADILALLGSGGGTTVAASSLGAMGEEEETAARAWQAHQLRKRRRKAGRGLGVAPEEGAAGAGLEEEGEAAGEGEGEEEQHQLAMPGTTFAPPMVFFDPLDIEATETARRRRQAGALMDAIKVRLAGLGGEGGGARGAFITPR